MLLSIPTPTPTPALTASVTPPPATTAFVPHARELLRLRADTSYGFSDYSYELASYLTCGNAVSALSCDSAYVSCLESAVDITYSGTDTLRYNDYYSGITACYCNYGVDYLNCFYSAINGAGCASYFGVSDWRSYESRWFLETCGTVPATLGGENAGKTTKRGKAPTSVSLAFQSVQVATLNSTVEPPTYTYTPNFQGVGSLLAAECAQTQFTLVEDVSTVIWLPIVGCASDKPQCCPWTAASTFDVGTVTVDTTITLTTTATTLGGNSGSNIPLNAFPAPATADQGKLKRCANDYYSISGNCCPSGYWPFTRNLGGQTPCWSSLPRTTSAPTLTAGLYGQPTHTEKPTSAVVNIVWAMSYPVQSKPGLSKGAIAGIAIGAVVGVAAIALLGFCLWRKNMALMQQKAAAQPPTQVQPQMIPQMAQQHAVPVTDLQKQAGMVQVLAEVPGAHVYAPQQLDGVPAMGPSPPDSRTVSMISGPNGTPVSALASQSTGTTVGDVSGGTASISSASGLLPSGQLPQHAAAGSPPPGAVYPAPIAEADETSFQRHQQFIQQQPYQRPYQQPYQQPYQPYQQQQQQYQQQQVYYIPGQAPVVYQQAAPIEMGSRTPVVPAAPIAGSAQHMPPQPAQNPANPVQSSGQNPLPQPNHQPVQTQSPEQPFTQAPPHELASL